MLESYLGTGTFSQRTGRDLPNPVKRLIVRVMSHYRESSGGSCSEQDREGEKQEKWLSDAPSHFSPVASLLLQLSTSIFAKTFTYKIQ